MRRKEKGRGGGTEPLHNNDVDKVSQSGVGSGPCWLFEKLTSWPLFAWAVDAPSLVCSQALPVPATLTVAGEVGFATPGGGEVNRAPQNLGGGSEKRVN